MCDMLLNSVLTEVSINIETTVMTPTNGPFLHLMKTSENQRFSNVFLGGGGVKSERWHEMVNSFNPSPNITKHS